MVAAGELVADLLCEGFIVSLPAVALGIFGVAEGVEGGNSNLAVYVVFTSKDKATVAVYPRKMPIAVIGRSTLATRSFNLANR